MADAVLSTSGMCSYCRRSEAKEFLVGTELGILYRLRKENPGKTFFLASRALICPNMKLTTLEDVRDSLASLSPVVTVPPDIRRKAGAADSGPFPVGRRRGGDVPGAFRLLRADGGGFLPFRGGRPVRKAFPLSAGRPRPDAGPPPPVPRPGGCGSRVAPRGRLPGYGRAREDASAGRVRRGRLPAPRPGGGGT